MRLVEHSFISTICSKLKQAKSSRKKGMPKQNNSPPTLFTFTLESINSAFGISADTLHALAASYGVTEDKLIVRALTLWAKSEIPDLDLDSPVLSDAQIKRLTDRRARIDSHHNQPLSLRDIFKQMEEQQGASDDPSKLVSSNGGDT